MSIAKSFNYKIWILIGIITALIVFGVDYYNQSRPVPNFSRFNPPVKEPEGNALYVTITIEVDGKGTTTPPPGEYEVPRFDSDDEATLQNWLSEMYTREKKFGEPVKNRIAIQAIPDYDWFFERWYAYAGALSEGDKTNENQVTINDSNFVRAVFVERVGLTELDLMADLGTFMTTIGQIEEPADVYNLDIDYGDWYPSNGEHIFIGNDMPDAAEFALLEAVLKDVHIGFEFNNGIWHESTWNSFEKNRTQARLDLPNESSAIHNAVAGYFTLHHHDYERYMQQVLQEYFGVTIDIEDYYTTVSGRLEPQKSAKNGIVSNLEIYNAAPGTGKEKLSIFTQNALEPRKKN